jgi:hypothetical protein
MIKYQLICDEDHEFEGWFGDSAAFESQQDCGLLTCPSCGSAAVRRALMAPNLASPKTRKSVPPQQPATAKSPFGPTSSGPASSGPTSSGPASYGSAPAAPGTAALPEQAARRMHALVSEMRALQTKIRDECRDVGDTFAEEARKMHYGEVEPEGIYGRATEEEREALDEEGIAVMDIPWLPKDN